MSIRKGTELRHQEVGVHMTFFWISRKTRAELECGTLESPDFDLVVWDYKFCLNSKCVYLGEIIAYGFSLLVCEVGTITDYHTAYPIGLLPGSNRMLPQPSYSIVIDNFDLAS